MRTLVKIKNAQDTILADYAESCISDVTSCLSDNGYDENQTTSSKSKIAINACRAQIITCMSVNGDATATPSPSSMTAWVQSVMVEGATNTAAAGVLAASISNEFDCTNNASGYWDGAKCYCAPGHTVGTMGSGSGASGYCYISGLTTGECQSVSGAAWNSRYSGCVCQNHAAYQGGVCTPWN